MLFFRNFPTCFYGFRNSLLVRRTECGQWKGRAFFCTSSTVRRVAGALRAAEAALRAAEAPVLSRPYISRPHLRVLSWPTATVQRTETVNTQRLRRFPIGRHLPDLSWTSP